MNSPLAPEAPAREAPAPEAPPSPFAPGASVFCTPCVYAYEAIRRSPPDLHARILASAFAMLAPEQRAAVKSIATAATGRGPYEHRTGFEEDSAVFRALQTLATSRDDYAFRWAIESMCDDELAALRSALA